MPRRAPLQNGRGRGRGERQARSGWDRGGGRSSGRGTPPSPPPTPAGLNRLRLGAPRSRGPASRLPRASTPGAGAQPLPQGNSLLSPLADRCRVSGCGLLPSFLETLLCCFSPFLSFSRSSCSWAPGGWSWGSSVGTGGQVGRPLPARSG